MLRQIHLHGSLADKFGSTPIPLDVDTPRAVIRGLSCVIPNFGKELRKNSQFQLVKVDHQKKRISSVSDETWNFNLGNAEELHVVPVVEGAGFEIAAYIGFAVGTMGYYVVGTIISIGISMAMSAIAQKLSAMPTTSGGSSTPASEKPSFIFNQVQNVTTPGNPVPLVYGECLTGSVVISVGVETEQI